MAVETKPETILRYSCNCKTKDIKNSDLPDWPWIPTCAMVCRNCGVIVASEIVTKAPRERIKCDKKIEGKFCIWRDKETGRCTHIFDCVPMIKPPTEQENTE